MSLFTLGLDIGSNSTGWALIDPDPKNPHIVDIGVRVFPEGVDRDKQGGEVSKNAARRAARSARRNRFRRAYRKDKLVRMLRRNSLLPTDSAQWNSLFLSDPYSLRAKGLDERLTLYELGRVLYHLNQRRGFWSNRKSGKAKEDGVVAKGATELQKNIQDSACRTMGEYFAKCLSEGKDIRGCYTFRKMYQDEFDALWDFQKRFYPDILTDDLKSQVRDQTIYFQRPLKPQPELIGDCELEPSQKRCPRADFHARRFRILQETNNLFIRNPDGTERILTPDERTKILDELFANKEVEFDTLRRIVGLMETHTFNLEEGKADKKSAKMKGDEFYAQLRKILKKDIDRLSVADLADINDLIIDDDLSDDQAIRMLVEQHRFTEEQAQKAANIPLPDKYARFSRIAIQKLLPHMEKGLKTHDAIKVVYSTYQAGKSVEIVDRLDAPADLRNPIVTKALFEVRKVVNAILREYGKPARIAVEMAGELRGSKKERDDIRDKIKENEVRNKQAREELMANHNVQNPSRDDIIKYKLWLECDKTCPYTGRSISPSALFGPYPEYQVEHILPYSRSLDDSFMNKTLCHVEENRRKREQTPYEVYHGTELYEKILQRIAILPWPKRRRFTQQTLELDNFIERQLNDTRYITREVLRWLKSLGVPVTGTRGQSTSELRHQWGLDNILDFIGNGQKNRDDHRHHAIDAAVTALTSPQHLRALAASKYNRDPNQKFDAPWTGFRDEMAQKVNGILVSHRVTRRVSGQLHEETNYGPTGQKDDKGQSIYAYRKKLEDLTGAMVVKIIDPVVRRVVTERMLEFNFDPETNSDKKPKKECWNQPLYMPNPKGGAKTEIKTVRICEILNNMIEINDDNGIPYRAVAPGSNHHIEIIEVQDKKGKIKYEGNVVTLFEAARRNRSGEPVIRKDHGEGKRFVCSLSKNELFMLEIEGNLVLHRLQKFDQNGTLIFRPHTHAGKLSDKDIPPIIQRRKPGTLKGYKVTIDPLGRICRAND